MKIKVVFYIDSFRIGGMHKQVLYLARHLNKSIFEPIICVQNTDGGLYSEFKKSGVRINSLKWTKRLDFKVFIRLIKFLWKEKPEIIFITEPQNFFYYRIARLFYYGNTIQIGSFRAMNFWYAHLGAKYKLIDNLLTILMILTSQKIIVNSKAMFKRYSSFLPSISKSKIEVIYNGSDFLFPITIDSFELRKSLNLSMDDFIVIMVARLDPWKDFDTLLHASSNVKKIIPNFKVLLVGDGELRFTLENRIKSMNLEKCVYLIGEKKDIYNYLNLADISVLSTNGEGFSNSILESMALGKPVIATNVGGNSELLGITGEEGLLINSNSPEELSDLIIQLFHDPLLRVSIGKNAKNKIEYLCNLNSFIQKFEFVFLSQLNHKH